MYLIIQMYLAAVQNIYRGTSKPASLIKPTMICTRIDQYLYRHTAVQYYTSVSFSFDFGVIEHGSRRIIVEVFDHDRRILSWQESDGGTVYLSEPV